MPHQPERPPVDSDAAPAVLNRAAFKKYVIMTLVTIVAIGIAAGTVAIGVAYQRISVLETDLNQRKLMRDRQQAENERRQRQAQVDVCLVLDHLADPDAADLQELRGRYECPPFVPDSVSPTPVPRD